MIGLQRRSSGTELFLIEIVLLKQIPITATFEIGAMIPINHSNLMACVTLSISKCRLIEDGDGRDSLGSWCRDLWMERGTSEAYWYQC